MINTTIFWYNYSSLSPYQEHTTLKNFLYNKPETLLTNFNNWQSIASKRKDFFVNASLHLEIVLQSHGFSKKLNKAIRIQSR